MVRSYGVEFIGMPGCLRDALSSRAPATETSESAHTSAASAASAAARLSPLFSSWVDAAAAAFDQFQPQFAVLSEFFALTASALVETKQCPFAIVHTTHPNCSPCKELGMPALPSYKDSWEKASAGNASGASGGFVIDMASKKAWSLWFGPLSGTNLSLSLSLSSSSLFASLFAFN